MCPRACAVAGPRIRPSAGLPRGAGLGAESDCVRAALSMTKKNTEFCAYLGLTKAQSLNNKFVRNSWSGEDLVKLAEFTEGKLMLVYPNSQQIQILSDKPEPKAEE